MSRSSSACLVSRSAGFVPGVWLSLPASSRRLRPAPRRLVARRRSAWAWIARRALRSLRRGVALPGAFAPVLLVASCPVCGARCSSRAVGPSSAWLLCPVCLASRFLPASRWLPAAGPVPVEIPPAQLALF